MTKMLLKYVHEFKDRHGKTRRYVRRAGFQRVPLPGDPGSPEFIDAYRGALDPKTAPRLEIGAARTVAGSVADVVARYFRSTEFQGLGPLTKKTYRNIIERFRADHGDKSIVRLGRQHIKDMMSKKVSTPAAANNFLKMLRLLMRVAIDAGMRSDDPTIGVKLLRSNSQGHPAWSEDHIAAFRKTHALGTRARLAMEMAYNTMQRRSDLVRMGRQHIQSSVLTIRQKKTGQTVPIPILPELQAALDMLPADQLTFLLTGDGKAFTAAGFGNWFREVCDEAGLPLRYNTHGLRKAGATRLAEAGCSDHEIMAWGGWRSLSEVQRYTRAANRRKLTQSAVHKLETRTTGGKPK